MVNIYIGFATLPTLCPDYKMYWASCCRPPGITSISGSAGVGFYFEAELNNMISNGPKNSSPLFLGPPIAYYCTGGFVFFDQGSDEINGDSLHYELIPAREDFPLANPVPYATGYSFTNPIDTTTSNPFTLNTQTGLITFVANTVETSVIALRINEYRFDSTFYVWVKVGSSNREIQVSIAGNCNATVNAGIILDPNAPGWSINSNGQKQLNATCGDSVINLKFTTSILCRSIGIDDLRIYTNNGNIIPIKSIYKNCQNGFASEFAITTFTPIVDGLYYILSGVNGNTFDSTPILNKCGKDVNPDTLGVVFVSGCPQNPYIQCLNLVNCDSIISNQGPHKYYNSWTFSSNTPSYETRWSIANGWFASSPNSDSVVVFYNGIGGSNFGGSLVLETKLGLCSYWDTLTTGNYVNIPAFHTSNVFISPNPSSSEINIIGVSKPSTFLFSNLHGQVFESTYIENPVNIRFKIDSYPQGLYRVQIFNESGVIVLSFIKI
jgi:hypothetical protein